MKGLTLFCLGLATGAGLIQFVSAQERQRIERLNHVGMVVSNYDEALDPATNGQASGITHFGVEVADVDAKVADLRRRGATLGDPAMTPANARFARIRDASGFQIELMEFGPESRQRQAMDAWNAQPR